MKALAVAKNNDVVHIAEGNYPGRMKCGWFKLEKPVSLFGGYSTDFTQRNPLKFKTMFQPENENNDKNDVRRSFAEHRSYCPCNDFYASPVKRHARGNYRNSRQRGEDHRIKDDLQYSKKTDVRRRE